MAKIITLDALYDYFSRLGQNVRFSSEKDNKELLVRTNATMRFDYEPNEEGADTGMMHVRLQACHVGKNRNGSSISMDAMMDALPSFYARPILGYIHEVDGEYEFGSHEMDVDDDGNIVYEEIPVGTITSQAGSVLYDADHEKHYAVVDGVIWEAYTKAADILRRYGDAPCSVELLIHDLSYDAKEKTLLLNKFVFTGVTILGKDDNGNDIEPGMEGANIQIFDNMVTASGEMSVSSEFGNDKKLEERRTAIVSESKIFDNEDQNKPELETVFDGDDSAADPGTEPAAEPDVAGENDDPDVSNQDDVQESEPAADQNDNDNVVEPELVAEEPVAAPEPVKSATDGDPAGDASDPAPAPVVTEANGEAPADDGVKKKVYVINGRQFELSLSQIVWAVDDLVNATYGEQDNEIYSCEVYEDTVIMKPWFGVQCYRQAYTKDDNEVFSLVGERVKVFSEYLTESEIEALNLMRATYAEYKQYKEESEAAKLAAAKEKVFEKFDEALSEEPEYLELKKNRGEFSANELELRCNALVGKRTMKFSAEKKKTDDVIRMDFSKSAAEERGPYGGLFDDKKKQNK